MRLYRRENRSTVSEVLEAVNCESSFTLGNLEFANIAFLPGKLGSEGSVPFRIMAHRGKRRKLGVQFSFKGVVFLLAF